MDYDELLSIHKKAFALNDKEKLILESLRFQDGDISVKSGSVLAFCGLIIATSIVQFTASSDSYIFILKDSFSWYINGVGLMLLFLSAGVCLRALTVSPGYSKDGKEALVQFYTLCILRKKLVSFSVKLTAFGSLCVLISLLLSTL